MRFALALALLPTLAAAQTQPPRRPLSKADVDDIAKLVMLEDQRQFDSTELARMFASPHPEVRRRAAMAIARINDRGRFTRPADTAQAQPRANQALAILRARPLDADTAVAATVVWAIGHTRDTVNVRFFDSLLSNPRAPKTVLTEAAYSLGMIAMPSPRVRAVLAKFLTDARADSATTPAIMEALLSIGRVNVRGDWAPVLKWTKSPSEEIRWRATWALFRGRDPAAVAPLLELTKDRSGLVRSWAVRGLTRVRTDSAGLGQQAEAVLIAAAKDADRRVSTEALTALATYTDQASVDALVAGLASRDSWLAIAAATSLGTIRPNSAVEALRAATTKNRPCAVRVVSMQTLRSIDSTGIGPIAASIARDTVPYCKAQGYTALARATNLEPAGSAARATMDAQLDSIKRERRVDLKSKDASVVVSTIRAMTAWADSSDLAVLRPWSTSHASIAVTGAAAAAVPVIERRLSGAPAPGRGGGGAGGAAGGGRGGRGGVTRPIEEYRAIVEKWVVPAYNGAPRPKARWETPKGPIELELYPGDAPLAVDDFVKTMDSGLIAGTEFTRVVPDFVDQQQTIRGGNTLRDEVNRQRLSRANLAWATAGLDTGSPGYTLNHTPQPHNEGNFTSMGRVTLGMDVVDRLDLGDRIVSGRMIKR